MEDFIKVLEKTRLFFQKLFSFQLNEVECNSSCCVCHDRTHSDEVRELQDILRHNQEHENDIETSATSTQTEPDKVAT